MTGARADEADEERPNDVTVSETDFENVPDASIRRGVLYALRDAHVRGAEISVTLLDDDAIREMNREFLDRDAVTDVIAFTLGGPGDGIVGDVYVGFEQAHRQAVDLAIDPTEELVRLAIHGTLHVLGHDHPEGPERLDSPMFALQERLVREALSAR